MQTAVTVRNVQPARVIRRIAQRRQLAGLGVANPQAEQIVGAAGSIATAATSAVAASVASGGVLSALPFAALAGPAAPFVALGAVAAALIASFIGGGCGSACTEASQAEQIYESAADDLGAVYRAGMITQAQFITAAQLLIQAGVQHEAQWTTSEAKNGATNLTNVINAMISSVSAQTPPPAQALDLNAAQALYIAPNTSGWYSASLAAGAQLASSYLQSLPASGVTGAVNSATSAASSILGSTIYGIPVWMLAAGLGLFLLIRD